MTKRPDPAFFEGITAFDRKTSLKKTTTRITNRDGTLIEEQMAADGTYHRTEIAGDTKDVSCVEKSYWYTTEDVVNGLLPWIEAIDDILDQGPWDEPHSMPTPLLESNEKAISRSWLWLSDYSGVLDARKLSATGITHVLTTNRMEPRQTNGLKRNCEANGIRYLNVDGEDADNYDMISHFDKHCREFVKEAREMEHGKIVIHCLAGQNRSGLMAAASLVALEKMELLPAVRLLKKKRGIVLTNETFRVQLVRFAKKEEKLGPKLHNTA